MTDQDSEEGPVATSELWGRTEGSGPPTPGVQPRYHSLKWLIKIVRKGLLPHQNCGGGQTGLDPVPPGFSPATPAQFFPPYPRPLFFFFFSDTPPKIQIILPTPPAHLDPAPAHFRQNPPYHHPFNPRVPAPLSSPQNSLSVWMKQRFFCCVQDRGTLLVSCAVFLETSMAISLPMLRQTAWHWATRLAWLRARIVSNGDNYKDARFVEVSSLTADDMSVQAVGHGDWKYVNETELEETFDCINGPLWRLRYVFNVTSE